MKQFVILIVLLAVAAIVYIAFNGGNPQTLHGDIGQIGQRIVIQGCPAEDSCAIDYKANGTWVVKHSRPGTY